MNTVVNQGTEFLISLPFTLAITTVIIVESQGEKYAIPLSDIKESIKVLKNRIEDRDYMQAITWNGRIIPVLDLSETLGYEPGPYHLDKKDRLSIVVVSYHEREIGLIVDQIIGKHEIVLKPIETHFQSVRGISGAAVMGDGDIILAIDVLEVFNQLKEKKSSTEEIPGPKMVSEMKNDKDTDKLPMHESTRINPETEANRLFNNAFLEATKTLSELTKTEMTLSECRIETLKIDYFLEQISDQMEDEFFASVVKMNDPMNTDILFLISKKDGINLFNTLMSSMKNIKKKKVRKAGKDVVAGIGEINNILGSCFINHFADYRNEDIHPTTPVNTFDMLGAILESITFQKSYIGIDVMLADAAIKQTDNKLFNVRMIILSDKNKLFELIREKQERN